MTDQSEGRTKVYRCKLVCVLPSDGQDVTVVARRSFRYAGRQFRRGETAVVKPEALSHLLLSRKVIWVKDLHGTKVDRSHDKLVPSVSVDWADEHGY